jgi:hypothetical protein
MIDRYTITAPAVPDSEVLKKLDEMKDYDPEQIQAIQPSFLLNSQYIRTSTRLRQGSNLTRSLSKKKKGSS